MLANQRTAQVRNLPTSHVIFSMPVRSHSQHNSSYFIRDKSRNPASKITSSRRVIFSRAVGFQISLMVLNNWRDHATQSIGSPACQFQIINHKANLWVYILGIFIPAPDVGGSMRARIEDEWLLTTALYTTALRAAWMAKQPVQIPQISKKKARTQADSTDASWASTGNKGGISSI